MAFDKEKIDAAYEKTDGQCHICRKQLARKNYGKAGARGAWEMEHSKPRSKGGTDHLNNLYAACIPCNRSKGNSSTRSARSKNGFKAAPFSDAKKRKHGLIGAGAIGSAALLLVPPQIKIPMVALGAVIGWVAGSSVEPE